MSDDRAVHPDELDDEERGALRRKARAATLDALRGLGGEARRDAIRRRALAGGGFTPRELAAPPPPAAAHKYDRLVDHQLSWALTGLKREGLLENPIRSTWRLAGAAAEAPVVLAQPGMDPSRIAELRSMPYRSYLGTQEWKRTRAAAVERAGHHCSLDVTHSERLEVHHNTYERLGQELATDLVVLCHDCHEHHHLGTSEPQAPSEQPRGIFASLRARLAA